MLFSLIKLLIVLVLLVTLLCIFRTWQMEHSANQEAFLKGTVPNPAPDGLYHGSVGRNVSWLGKKFSAEGGSASGGDAFIGTGINVFDDGDGVRSERYQFVTSIGKGVRDTEKDVLKIDYNITANPWWVRFIFDEIVQTAPNEYLGKLHARFISGYPFTLGYFTLKK